MKRKIGLVMIFVFIGSGVFAEEFDNGINYREIFFNDFPSRTQFDLSFLAANSYAKALRAKDNRWPAFLLNLILGCGIGSYVQGDTFGGNIGLIGELGSLTLVVIGMIPKEEQIYYLGYSGVGKMLFLATRIFELVRPFTYANKFSVTVVPSFDNKGQPVLTSYVSFKMK